MAGKVVLHIGEGKQVASALDETWDLVYLDADKPGYLDYYKMLLPRLRKGGWFLADNALWDGRVLEAEAAKDKETRGIIAFNEYVSRDESVEKLLMPLRDGIMIIRKK